MTEFEYQVAKSSAFVLALLLTLGLQFLRPHSGSIARRGTGRHGGRDSARSEAHGPAHGSTDGRAHGQTVGQAGGQSSWRVNATAWAFNVVILGVVCAGCACAVSRWAEARELGLLNRVEMLGVHAWLALPITVLGMDFVSYVWHRANHRLSLLWRFHQVHHSDSNFTATTAVRFHFGELLLALPLRLAAVIVLGVSIPGVIAFEVLFAFANFVEHGDIDLPRWIEAPMALLFITPALHRRHHSRESELLNSNYGTIFSFWDRAFHSFGPSTSEAEIQIGLPGLADGLSARELILLPIRGVFRGERSEAPRL